MPEYQQNIHIRTIFEALFCRMVKLNRTKDTRMRAAEDMNCRLLMVVIDDDGVRGAVE